MNNDSLYIAESYRLVKAEHEVTLLKRLLAEKLRSYSGITYSELETICTMLGITKAKEEKPDEQSHPDRQTDC